MTEWGPRAHATLEVSGLRRSFGDREVLAGVSLRAETGTVTSVVGANGSGKTTLLRTIGGSLDAAEGKVAIGEAPPGRGWATFVPAGDRMLNWRLTVAQNLAFFARLAGFAGDERVARIRGAADALGTEALLNRPVGECSTGQRRRIMLSVGFLPGAPVVLLDEPFADLDDDARAIVNGVCVSWARSGGTIVYATPSEGDGPVADTTLYLVGGRIQESAA